MKKKYFTEEERRVGRNRKRKELRKINKERIKKEKKKYYENHKEYCLKKSKEYCENHKGKITTYQIKYRKKHKSELYIKAKKYRKIHKKELNVKAKNWHNNRLKIDINYKITCNLRGRLYHALKENSKVGSAVRDLGCSIPELKFYLELKFQENMSWENWGEWHIDHIKPLSSFNLQNREEFLKACHYTNLQPLWAEENLKKNGKIS